MKHFLLLRDRVSYCIYTRYCEGAEGCVGWVGVL